ncbi:hypothetical protein GCM10007424_15650 [Flavobacterium suaedae]|uniref:DUF5034 domain-containing protein n=1 Tax=Flavobacterium suaedae TaxID=1767027 RepID=A0ABQ1JWH5_9FLAO|nr:DUF5034 domain-containing protein [Flavobacterium suaedae]GGB76509.1 hypothetical protein GCM10007424_15650 [Flavobacterium suaedae]
MKKKILVAFFGLNLFGFVACFNCEEWKYIDYNGIEVEVRNPVVSVNDSLSFGYKTTGSEYLAITKSFSHFSNTVYAFDCDKGYGGDKYPLVSISITSDTDFDETHPAGTELNDIIYTRGTIEGEYGVYGTLPEFDPSTINTYYMYLKAIPNNDNPHRFTIEIERVNGDVMTATSEEIVWE